MTKLKKILLGFLTFFTITTSSGVVLLSINKNEVKLVKNETTINPDIDDNGKNKINISDSQLAYTNLVTITQEEVIDIIYEFRSKIFSGLPTDDIEKKHITIESFKTNVITNSLVVSNITLSKYVNSSNNVVNEYKKFGSLTITGFKVTPSHPDGFPTEQLKEIGWLDCNDKNMYPYQFVSIYLENDPLNTKRQQLIQEIIDQATMSLKLNNNVEILSTTTSTVKLYQESESNIEAFKNQGIYPSLNNESNDTSNGQLKFEVTFNNVKINGATTNKKIEIRIYNAKIINFHKTGNNDNVNSVASEVLDSVFPSKHPLSISISELETTIENWINNDRPIELKSDISIEEEPTYLDTSIIVKYHMTNYISSAANAPVISKKSGPYTLTITNFSKNNETEVINTTPNDSINSPITVSSEWSNTFASDLTYSQLSSFLSSNIITKIFNNLPNDYATANKNPKLVSHISNDELGQVELSFTLTYFIKNNQAVEGESAAYKIILIGFKKQEGFKYFQTTMAKPSLHLYNIDYLKFIKQELVQYINGGQYFSKKVESQLLTFINNSLDKNNSNILSVPNIDSHTDKIIYRIPEISNITGDESWSKGFTITLTDLRYNYNHVIANDKVLSTTFEAFQENPKIYSINDLISITNELPPVEVGSSELVVPTFRPGIGNTQTGQGQIIFTFPKFYDRTLGLIENHEILFNYKFQTDDVSINPEIKRPFVESIPVSELHNDWSSLTYDNLMYTLRVKESKDTIQNILNSDEVKKKLFVNEEYYSSTINFLDASTSGKKVFLVLSSNANNVPFSVEVTNIQTINNSTSFRALIPPSNINSSNIYDYLELSPSEELMNRVQQFIEIRFLPPYAKALKVDVFAKVNNETNPNYDTVYINYIFDYVYIQTDNGYDVAKNYVLQQKISNLSVSSNSNNVRSEIVKYGPLEDIEKSRINQNLDWIITVSVISGAFLLTIILAAFIGLRKYKNNKK